MSHFSSSNPPKSFWSFNKIKKVEGVAIGIIFSMTRKYMISSSYINNILKFGATTYTYVNYFPSFAFPFTFPCIRRPQSVPIVRCSHSSCYFQKRLIKGISRGNIWPIRHILLCWEYYKLSQFKKVLAIPPNPRGVSGSRDWEFTASWGSRGSVTPCSDNIGTRGTAVIIEGWIWKPGYEDTPPISASSRARLRKAESWDSSLAALYIFLMGLTPASGLLSLA